MAQTHLSALFHTHFLVCKQVARLSGVHVEFAERVPFMRGGPRATDAAPHARFAAALCAARLLCEGDLSELEELWGDGSGILHKGRLVNCVCMCVCGGGVTMAGCV
jgi:hypothetical protein